VCTQKAEPLRFSSTLLTEKIQEGALAPSWYFDSVRQNLAPFRDAICDAKGLVNPNEGWLQ